VKAGKFIVIYGPNNLGKTTQAKLLAFNLTLAGQNARYLKYPVYEIPTGQRIDAALRRDLRLPDLELQQEFVANRRCFEPILRAMLNNGEIVVAEDYKGTGIAWGMVNGIPVEEMEEMNGGLLDEDLAICLDGERFSSGIERGHRYEEQRDWQLARRVHQELAERYNWEVVNANQSEEKVGSDIWDIVAARLNF
jgi:thymidylate kinase